MSLADQPAYPLNELHGDGSHYCTHFGMTLREHYAGLAMQGLLASPDEWDADESPGVVAKNAVRCADALIAELRKEAT